MIKPKIKDVKKGMVFKVKSREFGVTNYAKVTERPYFTKRGDRPDIFYALFVNPKDFSKKRLQLGREFAVWDWNYVGTLSDKWTRVR